MTETKGEYHQSHEDKERLLRSVIAFHYTSRGLWEQIQRARFLTPSTPLVRYRGRETASFPSDAYTPFNFAFMDSPRPEQWVRNENLPLSLKGYNSWSTLMTAILTQNYRSDRLTVVGFDVLPTDEAYVVDWWEVEKQILGKILGNGGFLLITEPKAWLNYIRSKTPLAEYQPGTHILPELVLGNRISTSRLTYVGSVKLVEGRGPRFKWSCSSATRDWCKKRGIMVKRA